MNTEDITKSVDDCFEIMKEANILTPSNKKVSEDELLKACQQIQELK